VEQKHTTSGPQHIVVSKYSIKLIYLINLAVQYSIELQITTSADVAFGTFSADVEDRHGHIVPKGELEKFVSQMEVNPESRMVSRNHDRTKLAGKTLWAGAREIKGTTYLIEAVGIFEQSRD
jgi:hypothetical protein